MERSIRYNCLIDLQSIQHKLSSDYSLTIYFSLLFLYIGGPSFSPYKPLQNVDFSKVGNMQLFFRNCTYILTKTQEERFEDMFLVKIASKRSSLRAFIGVEPLPLLSEQNNTAPVIAVISVTTKDSVTICF